MTQDPEPTYTAMELPVENMTDQQQLMLAILLQEGALRMRELIVAKLEAETEDLTKDQIIAIVNSTLPNVFDMGEENDEKDETDASTREDLHQ